MNSENAAICVSNIEEIKQALSRLIEEKHLILEYANMRINVVFEIMMLIK